MACGWLEMPFWTFFGATLLGKAVFKAHIQAVSLVVIMSEPVFNAMLDAIDEVPYAGDAIAAALKGARESAQAKFASDEPHEEPEVRSCCLCTVAPSSCVCPLPRAWLTLCPPNTQTNYLSLLLAVLVIGMVLFFVTSILEQLAQRNKKREDLKRCETPGVRLPLPYFGRRRGPVLARSTVSASSVCCSVFSLNLFLLAALQSSNKPMAPTPRAHWTRLLSLCPGR